jgi:hypothetical protein
MTATPADTPVTTPVVGSTVAIAGIPLLHTPPAVTSDKVRVEPAQTEPPPAIAAGAGVTVITLVVRQPPILYVMVVTPAETPVTTPDAESTDAIEGLRLVHKPPDIESPNVVEDPVHTVLLPEIGAGAAVTVTDLVTLQPPTV